jgi:hypothetical protein
MRLPWTIITIILAMMLVSCEGENLTAMEKQHNRSGKPIEVTVFEYKDYNDVNRALYKFQRENNQVKNKDPSLAWSAWDLEEPYQCHIHIKPPEKIDDDDVMSLGHEMAHCLYGSYHK